MMNYKEILAKGKEAYVKFKEVYGAEGLEARFVVQFQNLQTYQYRTTPDSLSKLSKIDFDEVIMVQFAVGTSIQKGRYSKFIPLAVKTLDIEKDFEVKLKDEDETPWE